MRTRRAFDGPIERPTFVWVGVALAILVGLMAVPVGAVMITDPFGSPLGIPNAWIADSALGSYLVPGILLFGVIGVGQLGAATLAVVRHPLAPWLMGAMGVGLLIWIAVQMLVIPPSFLQPTILIVGLIEGFIALAWIRRPSHLPRTGVR